MKHSFSTSQFVGKDGGVVFFFFLRWRYFDDILKVDLMTCTDNSGHFIKMRRAFWALVLDKSPTLAF